MSTTKTRFQQVIKNKASVAARVEAEENSRDQFESALLTKMQGKQSGELTVEQFRMSIVERGPNGEYLDTLTEHAWWAWTTSRKTDPDHSFLGHRETVETVARVLAVQYAKEAQIPSQHAWDKSPSTFMRVAKAIVRRVRQAQQRGTVPKLRFENPEVPGRKS